MDDIEGDINSHLSPEKNIVKGQQECKYPNKGLKFINDSTQNATILKKKNEKKNNYTIWSVPCYYSEHSDTLMHETQIFF